MKALVKKSGLIAAAVLLMFAAGCSFSPEGEEYQLPEGMGAVRLDFADSIERTILPDDASLKDLAIYELEFFDDSAASYLVVYMDNSNRGDPIPLDEGDYTLTVKAYAEGDYNGKDAAPDNLGDVVASTSTPIPVEVKIINTIANPADVKVVLKVPTAVGAGEGTFEWSVTYNTDPEETSTPTGTVLSTKIIVTTMTDVVKINRTYTTPTTKTTDSAILDAGYYFVDLAITVENADNPDLVEIFKSRHILHVHTDLTSVFDYEFTYNGASMGDIKLYARVNTWEVEVIGNVEFVLEYTAGTTLGANPVVIKDGKVIEIKEGGAITVNINNFTAFTGGVKWNFFQGYDDFKEEDVYLHKTTQTFTINLATEDFGHCLLGRQYDVSVFGTVGTTMYSAYFKFEVVEDN